MLPNQTSTFDFGYLKVVARKGELSVHKNDDFWIGSVLSDFETNTLRSEIHIALLIPYCQTSRMKSILLQTSSDLGYGNIAPRTNWGKIATVVYAIIGIPLMLLYLTNIGDILAKSFRYVYGRICSCGSSDPYKRRRHNNHHHHPSENYRVHHIVAHNSPKRHHPNSEPGVQDKLHMPPEDEVRIENMADLDLDLEYEKPRVRVPITLCLLILIGYISGGAVLFSLWEGWGFLDGSYFCFVTLSTIGFGDLVPGDSVVSDEGTQEKLVICSLYLLIGMALIAMCFNLMQEEVIHKVRNCGRRIGIIKDQEEEDDMG
ncbi:uncharacterized protein CDAR_305131 [Caerostris darwini]|uniref:Potassium channel domain-containing protein n=1 Tax=Caerostris darwini TaxID=1538125 RepID=A0AAV4RFM4_9ARAC|nr:uncharacterized protein CDAR_305131 [Caerostris darwini]